MNPNASPGLSSGSPSPGHRSVPLATPPWVTSPAAATSGGGYVHPLTAAASMIASTSQQSPHSIFGDSPADVAHDDVGSPASQPLTEQGMLDLLAGMDLAQLLESLGSSGSGELMEPEPVEPRLDLEEVTDQGLTRSLEDAVDIKEEDEAGMRSCALRPLDRRIVLTPGIMSEYIAALFGDRCPEKLTEACKALSCAIGRQLSEVRVSASLTLHYGALPVREHEISDQSILWMRRVVEVLLSAGGEPMTPDALRCTLRQRHGRFPGGITFQNLLVALMRRCRIYAEHPGTDVSLGVGSLLAGSAVQQLVRVTPAALACLPDLLARRQREPDKRPDCREIRATFPELTNNTIREVISAVYGGKHATVLREQPLKVPQALVRERAAATVEDHKLLALLRNRPGTFDDIWSRVRRLSLGERWPYKELKQQLAQLQEIARSGPYYYLAGEKCPDSIKLRASSTLLAVWNHMWERVAINGVLASNMVPGHLQLRWSKASEARRGAMIVMKASSPEAKALVNSDAYKTRGYPPLARRTAFYKLDPDWKYEEVSEAELTARVREYMCARPDAVVPMRALNALTKNRCAKMLTVLRKLMEKGELEKAKGGYRLAGDDQSVLRNSSSSRDASRVPTPFSMGSVPGVDSVALQQLADRSPWSPGSPWGVSPGPVSPTPLLEQYDPVSGLRWFRQGPNGCLQAALCNLLGEPWITLPPATAGQQGLSGEIGSACFVDVNGVPQQRLTPDGRPLGQLVIPLATLPHLLPLIEQLPEGLCLYRGDISRQGASAGGVGGHFVTLRFANHQWYLIDSLGQGPVPVKPQDYLGRMPHGLMALLPVDARVRATGIWQIATTMQRVAHVESVCRMVNDARVNPGSLLGWLQARQLDARDLRQPQTVAAVLKAMDGADRHIRPMALIDALAHLPVGRVDHWTALAAVRASGCVPDMLQQLDALRQSPVHLCLGTQPLNLCAYKVGNEWRCLAEQETAQFQDLQTPQLAEQPLAAVLERAYTNLARDQAPLPPHQRAEADRLQARTQLVVLLPA